MSETTTLIRSGDHVTLTDERVIVKVGTADGANLAPVLRLLVPEALSEVSARMMREAGITIHALPSGATLHKAAHRRRLPDHLFHASLVFQLGLRARISLQRHPATAAGSVSIGEAVAFLTGLDFADAADRVAADDAVTL